MCSDHEYADCVTQCGIRDHDIHGAPGMRVRAMTERRTRGFDVSGPVLPLSGKSNCV